MSKDIHILVPEEMKAELQLYYSGYGEMSNLFRRIAELVLIQLRAGTPVSPTNTAIAILEDEKQRGMRGGDTSDGS